MGSWLLPIYQGNCTWAKIEEGKESDSFKKIKKPTNFKED